MTAVLITCCFKLPSVCVNKCIHLYSHKMCLKEKCAYMYSNYLLVKNNLCVCVGGGVAFHNNVIVTCSCC